MCVHLNFPLKYKNETSATVDVVSSSIYSVDVFAPCPLIGGTP